MDATSNLMIQNLQNQHSLQLVDHINKKRSPHRNIGLIFGIVQGQKSTRYSIGTGFTINQYVILAAAHMFYPKKYQDYVFCPYKLQHYYGEKQYRIEQTSKFIPKEYQQCYHNNKMQQTEKNIKLFEHDYCFLKLTQKLNINFFPQFLRHPYRTQDINNILSDEQIKQGTSLNIYGFPQLSNIQRGGESKGLTKLQELGQLNPFFKNPNINKSLFYFEKNIECLPGFSGSPVWIYADSESLNNLEMHEKKFFDKMLLVGLIVATIKTKQKGKQKGTQTEDQQPIQQAAICQIQQKPLKPIKQPTEQAAQRSIQKPNITVIRIITPQIIEKLVAWMNNDQQLKNYKLTFIKNSQGYFRSTNQDMYKEQQQASVQKEQKIKKKIIRKNKKQKITETNKSESMVIRKYQNNQIIDPKSILTKYHKNGINRFKINVIDPKTQKIVGRIEYISKHKQKKGQITHYFVKYDDDNELLQSNLIKKTKCENKLYLPPNKALTIRSNVQDCLIHLENGQEKSKKMSTKIIFQLQKQEKISEQIPLSEYYKSDEQFQLFHQFSIVYDKKKQMVDVEQ